MTQTASVHIYKAAGDHPRHSFSVDVVNLPDIWDCAKEGELIEVCFNFDDVGEPNFGQTQSDWYRISEDREVWKLVRRSDAAHRLHRGEGTIDDPKFCKECQKIM